MMFLGVFTVFILPLGLVIAAQSVRRSEFGKSLFGRLLELVLYIIAVLSIIGSLVIIFKLF